MDEKISVGAYPCGRQHNDTNHNIQTTTHKGNEMFLILDHKRKEKAREADVEAKELEKVPELHADAKSEHQIVYRAC